MNSGTRNLALGHGLGERVCQWCSNLHCQRKNKKNWCFNKNLSAELSPQKKKDKFSIAIVCGCYLDKNDLGPLSPSDDTVSINRYCGWLKGIDRVGLPSRSRRIYLAWNYSESENVQTNFDIDILRLIPGSRATLMRHTAVHSTVFKHSESFSSIDRWGPVNYFVHQHTIIRFYYESETQIMACHTTRNEQHVYFWSHYNLLSCFFRVTGRSESI